MHPRLRQFNFSQKRTPGRLLSCRGVVTLTLLLFSTVLPATMSALAQMPAITGVNPNPVIGSERAQPITITGSDFATNCVVRLSDKRLGKVYSVRFLKSRSSSQIVFHHVFPPFPASWSVSVLSPDGPASGEFEFPVKAPKVVPVITHANPDPIPAMNGPQHFTINGLNFEPECKVILLDTKTGEQFEILPSKLRSSTQITITPDFTATPGDWAVRVVNPSGDASNAFRVRVASASSIRLRRILQSWQFTAAVCLSALMFAALWHRKQRRRWEGGLEQANASATARERNRLIKDLHDGLSHELTKVACYSELVQNQLSGSPETIRDGLKTIAASARNAVDYANVLVWAHDPLFDTLDDLAAYLREKAERLLDSAGVQCDLDFPSALSKVPLGGHYRREIVLAFLEALNNLVKHSEATDAKISLRIARFNSAESKASPPGHCGEECIEITICDNGKGVEMPKVSKSGHGLKNMRQRVEALNGQFGIESSPGNGVRVSMRVPLPSASELLQRNPAP
ncbi:MAG: hypothetical protein HY735_00105 [Verrucomicrobia bacterium]|nr:hypothetical protein [Verrucomicrobiota bacterium]